MDKRLSYTSQKGGEKRALKKVLIYILSEGKGGVEEYAMNLSRYVDKPSDKYGYLVMGESTVYEQELKQLGVDYFFIPHKRHTWSNIKAYSKILKQLRTEYEVVYFNTSGLYYPIPYFFSIKNKYRIILHSHSIAGPKIKSIIHYLNRKWIVKKAAARLSCSTQAGQWMFGERDFILIPNAVNLNRFEFCADKREECRREYGLEDDLVIGTIGRLHWGKNQIFLVEILKALIDRNVKAKLLLVGDGDMKEQIKARAEALCLKDKLILAGQTDKSEVFYSAMDCFLLPSFAEGFPVTLIEAQANGLPCIVSDKVTQETNISGKIKYLSIEDTPESWANEVLKNLDRYNCIAKLKSHGYDVKELERIVWNYLATKG